ncbi:Eukaryotic aspartyl protease [Aphelenchoides besseyi]|nr:Eukaryotic aspartyl protease [Aphelenchoides besseyi]
MLFVFLLFVFVDGQNEGFSFKLNRKVKLKPNVLMPENATFRAIYKQRIISRGNTLYTGKFVSYTLSQYERFEGFVSIGDPKQKFEVIFDTGNKGLMSEHCHAQKQVYDPKKSKTSYSTHKLFHVEYGIGATVGYLYQDVFAFGSPNGKQLELKKPITFGGAIHLVDGDQGILGLTYNFPEDRAPTIFGEAVKQKVLAPVFSIFFKKCPNGRENCSNAGEIMLGRQDTENCGKVLDWAPVVRGSTDWTFVVDSIQIGRKFIWKFPFLALSDTGSSHFFVPTPLLKKIASAVGGRWIGEGLLISCRNRLSFYIFIRGKLYTVPFAEVSQKLGHDRCLLLVGDNDETTWIFGDPWIRTYCQIHDWDRKRIGFAKAKK